MRTAKRPTRKRKTDPRDNIRPLAPGFLIAAPTMTDPRFRGTVVLLAEASHEGAIGFVVNRSTPYTLGDLAGDIGFEIDDTLTREAVHYGGPVSPERGWVVFRDEAALDRTSTAHMLHVNGEIHVAATLEVLGEFVTAQKPGPFRLLLGYAGWAPTQLEDEIREGAWLPLDLHEDLIFMRPPDEVYAMALDRLGLHAGGFVMGTGGSA